MNTQSDCLFQRTVLEPSESGRLVPGITIPIWVYRYTHPAHGWSLSIGTHGAPQSGTFSLGGFRIVPADRAALPGFNPDKEAIGLASGMEEKVFWSKLVGVAGPQGERWLSKIVGGKCVLLPTAGSRVGEPLDRELLDFATTCLNDFEKTVGVNLTTGQDLGHQLMSDGKTQSLVYLHDHFMGSVLSDTSKPTAEGNYQTLLGALSALSIPLHGARIGLIGCGNIGSCLVDRLFAEGCQLEVIEPSESRCEELRAKGITTFTPAQKAEFVRRPHVAIAVNARGGSLDKETIEALCENSATKVICGAENLVMPDPSGVEAFRRAGKIFTPTEYCGMMGYLTAVEEYFCRRAQIPFEIESMFAPARKLAESTRIATERCVAHGFALSFEDELKAAYSH